MMLYHNLPLVCGSCIHYYIIIYDTLFVQLHVVEMNNSGVCVYKSEDSPYHWMSIITYIYMCTCVCKILIISKFVDE